MKEKFFNLPKMAQCIIATVVWVIAVVGFVGCSVLKSYEVDMMWLIILLTCIGMGASVLAICITIEMLTVKADKENK